MEFRLTCRRIAKARRTIRGWDKLRDVDTEAKPVEMAEYLIKHPLLWGMLLSSAEESIKAEFMAHSQRYLPMQKNLLTRGVSVQPSLD